MKGERLSFAEKQEARAAAKRLRVDAYRRKVGIRTVPPEGRLPFVCGVENCWKSYGHTGAHGLAA